MNLGGTARNMTSRVDVTVLLESTAPIETQSEIRNRVDAISECCLEQCRTLVKSAPYSVYVCVWPVTALLPRRKLTRYQRTHFNLSDFYSSISAALAINHARLALKGEFNSGPKREFNNKGWSTLLRSNQLLHQGNFRKLSHLIRLIDTSCVGVIICQAK